MLFTELKETVASEVSNLPSEGEEGKEETKDALNETEAVPEETVGEDREGSTLAVLELCVDWIMHSHHTDEGVSKEGSKISLGGGK